VDGFFHAQGGYAESGRVVAELLAEAGRQGVRLYEGETVAGLLEEKGRVSGVLTEAGLRLAADIVLVAAGTWTHLLVPELKPVMRSVGQPVFHLRPDNPALFAPPGFVVFTADVANSGWYGFPVHPSQGVVKIANHGRGRLLHPAEDERIVAQSETEKLRRFLRETFPALVESSVVYTRLCLYCDTLDEHLWIDHHPQRPGLVVAAGGSGHGFKFAPVLGDLIADVVEQKPNPYEDKFGWRELAAGTTGQEAARNH
jgi:glycine/D-amino acid oxidase-like deaminating enzyme